MTLTLLFDLDDTLLSNDIDSFLPAYLRTLGQYLASHVAPEKLVRDLLTATQQMLSNNTAALTLEQAFDQSFYPAIGKTKEEMRPVLEQFYDQVFPSLQSLTSPRPEASSLVQLALRQGHTLVIATNPLFPQKAIEHRLRWAGLDPNHGAFALITTYEHFHFSKPNPAYYAEILAQLGWPNQPAVMIGNSLSDDLTPASLLDLPVFWVTGSAAPLPDGFHPISASGTLADAAAWINKVDSANLRQAFAAPQAIQAVLKSTPAALDTLCRNLTRRQWEEKPEPGEWSLTEILCHLRDVDREINIPRLIKTLSEPSPFLPGVNSDTWADDRGYAKENGQTALIEFIQARSQLVERLQNLAPAQWEAVARHAIFGPTNVRELFSFTITHDRLHTQQAINTVKKLA